MMTASKNALNGICFLRILFLFTTVHSRYMRNGEANTCYGPPGYKADFLTGCETYYFCHTDGLKESFACPFGMLFDERRGQCDTAINVNCLPPALQPHPNSALLTGPEGSPPGPSPQSQQPSQIAAHQNYPSAQPTSQGSPPSGNPPQSANLGTSSGSNAMDFLAALLFPPLSDQHGLNDFVQSAPSGVRQSFLRVAGEGQLTPNQYPAYVEPSASTGTGQAARPVYREHTGNGMVMEGAVGRESPGSSAGGGGFRRVSRPSPAMNPLDAFENGIAGYQMAPQNQPAAGYGMPGYAMNGYNSYMTGQLNMQQQHHQSAQNHSALMGSPLSPVAGLSHGAQVEALRPLMQSLMRNPHQPHLRRMASMIAGATAMDMGLINGKLATDPLGASAADPALAAAKKNKVLDDGLVDA